MRQKDVGQGQHQPPPLQRFHQHPALETFMRAGHGFRDILGIAARDGGNGAPGRGILNLQILTAVGRNGLAPDEVVIALPQRQRFEFRDMPFSSAFISFLPQCRFPPPATPSRDVRQVNFLIVNNLIHKTPRTLFSGHPTRRPGLSGPGDGSIRHRSGRSCVQGAPSPEHRHECRENRGSPRARPPRNRTTARHSLCDPHSRQP